MFLLTRIISRTPLHLLLAMIFMKSQQSVLLSIKCKQSFVVALPKTFLLFVHLLYFIIKYDDVWQHFQISSSSKKVCFSYYNLDLKIRPLMNSGSKKLEKKKSLIKINEKQQQKEDKFRTLSNEKDKKYSPKKMKQGKDQLKDLLKESYMFVKEENESLLNKLRRKMKKIEELKHIIGQLQQKNHLKQQMDQNIQSKGAQKIKGPEQSLRNSRRYDDIIKQSQQIAKLSLQKYKKIEKQMQQQRIKFQQEIHHLRQSNDRLRDQLSSRKDIILDHTTSKKKSKSINKSTSKILLENDQLVELKMLKEKQLLWLAKQDELKRMLTQITSKINNFEINYAITEEKSKRYKEELEKMHEKYEIKCRKSKQNNQKWFNIFGEFMKQTQSINKEIQSVKKLFMSILKEVLQKYQNKF